MQDAPRLGQHLPALDVPERNARTHSATNPGSARAFLRLAKQPHGSCEATHPFASLRQALSPPPHRPCFSPHLGMTYLFAQARACSCDTGARPACCAARTTAPGKSAKSSSLRSSSSASGGKKRSSTSTYTEYTPARSGQAVAGAACQAAAAPAAHPAPEGCGTIIDGRQRRQPQRRQKCECTRCPCRRRTSQQLVAVVEHLLLPQAQRLKQQRAAQRVERVGAVAHGRHGVARKLQKALGGGAVLACAPAAAAKCTCGAHHSRGEQRQARVASCCAAHALW